MLANRQITKSNLEPYNHEERDTRLFVHVPDAALTNIQKVTIIENDTDIVVIALYNFEYGCGKNRRWLPIHNYVKALQFWYASQGAKLFHHFVEEEKRLHRMRGAVSLKLLNVFLDIYI